MRFLKLFLLVTIVALSSIAFAGDQVPFQATLASVGPITASPDPVCGEGNFKVSLEAIGRMDHLGLIADKQWHCMVGLPDSEGKWWFDKGDCTFWAANGDSVHGTYSGYLLVADFTIHGDFVIDGGTGRFTGATGSAKALGVQLMGPNGPTGSVLTLTGTISTVGSLK
jgi:hypothetical protein